MESWVSVFCWVLLWPSIIRPLTSKQRVNIELPKDDLAILSAKKYFGENCNRPSDGGSLSSNIADNYGIDKGG